MLSAIAATVAAILVAVNLYVSGRREHSRWAREAMVDVFVTFLDAGFSRVAAGEKLAGLPPNATEAETIQSREEATTAHQTETEMLTKMRVLSKDVVVEAAMRLHLATHVFVDLMEAETADSARDELNAADEDVWRARQTFLAALKAEIGLKPVVSSVRHKLPRRLG